MLQSGLLDRIQFHDQALFDDNPAWILSTEGQRDDLMTTTSPTVLVERLLPENWSLSERLRPDGIPDTTRNIMMKSESKIQTITATMGSENIESANGFGNGKGTARLPTAGRSEKKSSKNAGKRSLKRSHTHVAARHACRKDWFTPRCYLTLDIHTTKR
jgi:hypothetical protein